MNWIKLRLSDVALGYDAPGGAGASVHAKPGSDAEKEIIAALSGLIGASRAPRGRALRQLRKRVRISHVNGKGAR